MKVYTESQLAAEFGISAWTVRRWRIKGALPHFRTAGRIFYRLEAVEKWMSQQEEQNAHQALVAKAPRLSSN